MKHSKTCPKCAGIRLLHIRQVADRMGDSYHHHTHPRPVPTPVSTEHSDEWRLARVPGKEPNTMANVGRVEACAGLADSRSSIRATWTTFPSTATT